MLLRGGASFQYLVGRETLSRLAGKPTRPTGLVQPTPTAAVEVVRGARGRGVGREERAGE